LVTELLVPFQARDFVMQCQVIFFREVGSSGESEASLTWPLAGDYIAHAVASIRPPSVIDLELRRVEHGIPDRV